VKQLGIASLSLLILVVLPLCAQRRVDTRDTYERILAVVPMIGRGTPDDPRRPMYAPLPNSAQTREGIIAFTFQASDDGNFALVEFVARDRAGLQAILADRGVRQDVKIFEKGADNPQAIAAEFRRYKRDFDPQQLSVRVP
jgi:hypothetical protein